MVNTMAMITNRLDKLDIQNPELYFSDPIKFEMIRIALAMMRIKGKVFLIRSFFLFQSSGSFGKFNSEDFW